jgi:hypothetical protein
MIKKTSVLLILMVLFLSLSAQNHTDSIKIVKVPGAGTRYIQSGRVLKLYEMEFVMNKNPQAINYLKSAKSLDVFTGIVAGCGAGIISYSLSFGISTGEFSLPGITVGCGLMIIAIPISLATKNKLKMAVDTYNERLKPLTDIEKTDIRFGFTPNGIGLTLTL